MARDRVARVAVIGAVLIVGAACGARATPGAAARPPSSSPTTVAVPVTVTVPPVTSDPPQPAPHARPPVVVAPRPMTIPPGGVTAIGDSVMVDATPSLEQAVPGIVVNAAVSRQVGDGIELVAAMRSAGQLGHSVVFALGTNGPFSASAFTELAQLTQGRHLVVVTAHCGHCGWIDSNNALVRADCTGSIDCTVADWYALAQANPAWFVDAPDDVHMPIGGPGAQAYAALVMRALET